MPPASRGAGEGGLPSPELTLRTAAASTLRAWFAWPGDRRCRTILDPPTSLRDRCRPGRRHPVCQTRWPCRFRTGLPLLPNNDKRVSAPSSTSHALNSFPPRHGGCRPHALSRFSAPFASARRRHPPNCPKLARSSAGASSAELWFRGDRRSAASPPARGPPRPPPRDAPLKARRCLDTFPLAHQESGERCPC